MKKVIAMLLVIMAAFALSACDDDNSFEQIFENAQMPQQSDSQNEESIGEDNIIETESPRTDTNKNNDAIFENDTANSQITDNIESLDDAEEAFRKEFDRTMSSLENEWTYLESVVISFDTYIENADKIEAFYDTVNDEVEELCILMYEYALIYADIIMETYESIDDMYDEFDEIYDDIYEDAGDDIYDDIYDGILDDMYEAYYDGILDDAYDTVPYRDWSDARSDEYDWWSDTRSDVYDSWSDVRSDIYDFWSDVRGDLWDDDIEDAKDRIEDFREDVAKMNGNIIEDDTTGSQKTDNIESLDDAEDALFMEFDRMISSLENGWTYLESTVTSFDTYIENADRIEAFYDTINENAEQMCILMYEYALKYAEIIMATNESADDMYDEFDEMYDDIYDDAGDYIYDDIYDGILDDMYEAFYDGILDDAYDTVPYGDWFDARSDEYDWWLDTRSDVYDSWLDVRSDIYDFWTDVRGDLWDDDIDHAKDRIEDFREDVEKMKR